MTTNDLAQARARAQAMRKLRRTADRLRAAGLERVYVERHDEDSGAISYCVCVDMPGCIGLIVGLFSEDASDLPVNTKALAEAVADALALVLEIE